MVKVEAYIFKIKLGLPMGSATPDEISMAKVNRIPLTHGTRMQAQTFLLDCLYSGLPSRVIK